MKIYAISDMHGQLDGLDPRDADLVLIAGDFARLERLEAYPSMQFQMIPGNHDLFAQEL